MLILTFLTRHTPAPTHAFKNNRSILRATGLRRAPREQGLHKLEIAGRPYGPPLGRDERQHGPGALPRPRPRRRHRRSHAAQADAAASGRGRRPAAGLQAAAGARGEHRRHGRSGPEAHTRRRDEQLRGGRAAVSSETLEPRDGMHEGRKHLRSYRCDARYGKWKKMCSGNQRVFVFERLRGFLQVIFIFWQSILIY